MTNPFVARAMIQDPAAFFGRRALIARILDNVRAHMCTSLVGERRSGKSSLLCHLCQHATHAGLRMQGFGGSLPPLFVYFDLQRVAALNEKAFFRMAAREIAKGLPAGDTPAEKAYDEPQEYFDAVVDRAAESFGVVLCLDEFEVICNDERFDSNFLQPLRAHANRQTITFITTSRSPLKPLIRETPHIRGSEFWNIFDEPPLYVALFSDAEAAEIRQTLSRGAELPFAGDEEKFLIQLAGKYPLFLQIGCYYAFQLNMERKEGGISQPWSDLERKRVHDQFMEAARPHFEYFWERFSSTERRLLAEPEIQDDDARQAVNGLKLKGLLGEDLQPFCSAFAEFAALNRNRDRGAAAPVLDAAPVAGAPARPPSPVITAPPAVEADTGMALDICLGRNRKIMVHVRGAFNQSFFCDNDAAWDDFGYLNRIADRARRIPSSASWRLDKQELGKAVKDLFNNPVLPETYTRCLGAAGSNERLRLTFRCPKEMLSFPFELINSLSTIQDGPAHIALMHPIRKSILTVQWRRPPLDTRFFREPGNRVLLVSSNVSGDFRVGAKIYRVPPIPNVQQETEVVKKLFDQAKGQGAPEVCVKLNPTATEFQKLIETGDFGIVHYSGHGFYAECPEQSCLLFQEDGAIRAIPAAQLNSMVDQTRIRFFYLSCCDAANSATLDTMLTNDFLGVADALLAAGIPSLVAMRWPLNDTAAVTLATTFYKELLSGQRVDVALLRARRYLQNRDPDDHSWLAPVLVMQ